jgi:hypothetical protein
MIKAMMPKIIASTLVRSPRIGIIKKHPKIKLAIANPEVFFCVISFMECFLLYYK